MQPRIIFLAAIIVIIGLVIWRTVANHVDFAKPDAVATAFVGAMKSGNMDKASKYWVPADAETWKTSATTAMRNMNSGVYERYLENFPASPKFTTTHGPKSPAGEQTLSVTDFSLDMRQIDGKWYVCKIPAW